MKYPVSLKLLTGQISIKISCIRLILDNNIRTRINFEAESELLGRVVLQSCKSFLRPGVIIKEFHN